MHDSLPSVPPGFWSLGGNAGVGVGGKTGRRPPCQETLLGAVVAALTLVDIFAVLALDSSVDLRVLPQ